MRELIVVSGRGMRIAARKPVQSFDPADGFIDSDVLATASGEESSVVCPPHRNYALAMAPPMSADALGLPSFTIAEIARELDLPSADLIFVEGVGGPRSPLAHDGDTVALADALDAHRVMLVAHPGLGTINDVLLSVDAFEGKRPLMVFMNRFDPTNDLHLANRDWLTARGGLDVAVAVSELAARYTTLEVS
jgi:dethiobiotin synthetase